MRGDGEVGEGGREEGREDGPGEEEEEGGKVGKVGDKAEGGRGKWSIEVFRGEGVRCLSLQKGLREQLRCEEYDS